MRNLVAAAGLLVSPLPYRAAGDAELVAGVDAIIKIACEEFFSAHQACVGLNAEALSTCGAPSHPGTEYEVVSRRRDEALLRVRNLRAESWVGVRSKLEVLLTISDWFGFEDPRIGEFGMELAAETYGLLVASEATKPPAKRDNASRRAHQPKRGPRFATTVDATRTS